MKYLGASDRYYAIQRNMSNDDITLHLNCMAFLLTIGDAASIGRDLTEYAIIAKHELNKKMEGKP